MSSVQPVVVHWFRRDLRLDDNRGFAAALSARVAKAPCLPVFIFDREILGKLEDSDDARVTFIFQTLQAMKQILRKQGSDVLCLVGKPEEIWTKLFRGDPAVLGKLAGRIKIVGISVNDDYEPRARERDLMVERLALKQGISFTRFKDQVIFEKSDVVKDDSRPYTVFTPYSKKWRSVLAASTTDPLRAEQCPLQKARLVDFESPMPSWGDIGFQPNSTIEFPGLRVETEVLKKYATLRDRPSVRGTSRLGLHLRFGTVSPRRLVAKALELKSETWLNELIWREFFMQILWHFPHVAESAFRPEYEQIRWRNNEHEFQLWCDGKTGYPLVDAGMRELNATGFMHNRVRMVAASFLVKHLLIDWRWGEAYFARRLLDFDLAANNGNWQWVAGSGCDAAPYFRVFNPELQLKKFDPKFDYVRHWVSEFGTEAYPPPVVDHAQARARVLRAYAVIKQRPD